MLVKCKALIAIGMVKLIHGHKSFTNFKREDAVLIAVQFWLFAISFIAVS